MILIFLGSLFVCNFWSILDHFNTMALFVVLCPFISALVLCIGGGFFQFQIRTNGNYLILSVKYFSVISGCWFCLLIILTLDVNTLCK